MYVIAKGPAPSEVGALIPAPSDAFGSGFSLLYSTLGVGIGGGAY